MRSIKRRREQMSNRRRSIGGCAPEHVCASERAIVLPSQYHMRDKQRDREHGISANRHAERGRGKREKKGRKMKQRVRSVVQDEREGKGVSVLTRCY